MIIQIENNKGDENYRLPIGTEVIFISGQRNSSTHPCFIKSGVIIEHKYHNAVKCHKTSKVFLPYDSQIILSGTAVNPVQTIISPIKGGKI